MLCVESFLPDSCFCSLLFQTEWRIRFANGDDYAGTVMDGAPHGTGTYKYSNGDIFTGG